jgi:hypothetical protein
MINVRRNSRKFFLLNKLNEYKLLFLEPFSQKGKTERDEIII